MISKEDYKYLKRNNLKKIFTILTQSDWLTTLFDLKLLRFLSKNDLGYWFYEYCKIRFFITQKVSIPMLVAILTTRCTLNCKECCHWMPHYTNKTHAPLLTLEQFKKDLDNVLKNVDCIHVFQFSGGEPLLNKDLPQMLVYARSKKQIKNIFITTNATIKFSKNLIDAIRKTHTTVQISDYRNVAKIPVYYNEIKMELRKNKIRIIPWEEDNDVLFRTMQEIYKTPIDGNSLEKLFTDCWDTRCNVLCDGKIYLCPTHLHIDKNIEAISDAINIRSSNTTKNDFINFYSKKYFDTCCYCHKENICYGAPVGEQIERMSHE